MALYHCSNQSEILGVSVSYNVIVPPKKYVKGGEPNSGPLPVLYLLHGLSDNENTWIRNTSIERHLWQSNFICVTPNVGRSFYADMVHGYKYWTFITEELPFMIQSTFSISCKREDTFVAGLSMGGYGAFKIALNYPERIRAAASFSGCLDLAAHVTNPVSLPKYDFELVFGKNVKIDKTENDLIYMLEKNANRSNMPSLYQSCGTEDFLYQDNKKFKNVAETNKYELYYEEEPATHEWGYWDRQINKAIAYFKKIRNLDLK